MMMETILIMKLSKAVVANIHKLLANPDECVVINLIKSGTLVRYLSCVDQLGVDVCNQLQQLFDQNLHKLDVRALTSLYKALSRGLVTIPNVSSLVGPSTSKRSSLYSTNY